MNPLTSHRVVAGVIVLIIFSISVPVIAGIFKIGVSRERKVGGATALEIERSNGVILLRGRAHELINEIGQKLVKASGQKDFDFRFSLIDVEPKHEKDKLINAFALPGGYIYIFKDMQEVIQTEDELAAVLAHEITHVTDHHWARQQSSDWDRSLLLTLGLGLSGASRSVANTADLVNFAMIQRYSRRHEQAADDNGLALMAKAGYNPQGMVTMLKALAKIAKDEPRLFAWMSDHPQLKTRLDRAERKARELTVINRQ